MNLLDFYHGFCTAFTPENYTAVHQLRDYKAVFDTDAGQRVLADLIHQSGMFRSAFGLSADDARRVEGQRDMVLHILARATAQTDEFGNVTPLSPPLARGPIDGPRDDRDPRDE